MNFHFVRGDDNIIPLKFEQNGSPVDITGWVIFLTVKRKIEDTDNDAALKKTVISSTNPSEGEIDIPLTALETDGMDGLYFYDIQYRDIEGNIKTVLLGYMDFAKDITRRTS